MLHNIRCYITMLHNIQCYVTILRQYVIPSNIASLCLLVWTSPLFFTSSSCEGAVCQLVFLSHSDKFDPKASLELLHGSHCEIYRICEGISARKACSYPCRNTKEVYLFPRTFTNVSSFDASFWGKNEKKFSFSLAACQSILRTEKIPLTNRHIHTSHCHPSKLRHFLGYSDLDVSLSKSCPNVSIY